MSTKHEIYVKGKVQGVFFRDFTKQKADSLGLKGTVQNMPEGYVKIVVEDAPGVNEFIEWCWEGSPASEVKDVEVTKYDSDEKFNSFQILH